VFISADGLPGTLVRDTWFETMPSKPSSAAALKMLA
jgi:hypothetical protein